MSQIRKAVTDNLGAVSWDPKGRPGVSNLMAIYGAVTGRSPAATEADFAGCDMLQFKEGVAVAVSEHLAPIQREYARLEADPGFVVGVLDAGAETAIAMAEATMVEARDAAGLTL